MNVVGAPLVCIGVAVWTWGFWNVVLLRRPAQPEPMHRREILLEPDKYTQPTRWDREDD